jgi:hypothetical protein
MISGLFSIELPRFCGKKVYGVFVFEHGLPNNYCTNQSHQNAP